MHENQSAQETSGRKETAPSETIRGKSLSQEEIEEINIELRF